MSMTYAEDIAAWSREQASLIRQGRFDLVDIEFVAEEIEDVGKSEQRELASRMAALLNHLLKWQLQPERRGASWEITIRNQRLGLSKRLARTPSLNPMLTDPDWQEEIWADALAACAAETGLVTLPLTCPWSFAQVLTLDWLPAD
ncbi:DUF29 domain-containing protein [uncultured Thiodictyon sp.]|uniref:DUF29 domain-containing protein n=1 Tax=uncultured Thiodictyon sp. TaxID=1846217 RepID=UPI0025E8DF4E|nr:DUF29 domain-containing protein [uncultured Thiodictyon sp.]